MKAFVTMLFTCWLMLLTTDDVSVFAAVINNNNSATHGTRLSKNMMMQDYYSLKFKEFDSSYEPSGIAQLPDQRVIIVDDEAEQALQIFQFNQARPFDRLRHFSAIAFKPAKKNFVSDLEGLTSDTQGYLYAITSHSRNSSGKIKKNRLKLMRFKMAESEVTELSVVKDLREWLMQAYPELQVSDKIKDVQRDGGFNIEGLVFNPETKHLVIGLRSPLNSVQQAIIISLGNPDRLFNDKHLPEKPLLPYYVDLQGAGVRDMAYDPHVQGLLILSGSSAEHKKPARLWLWRQLPERQAQQITIQERSDLRTAEGVAPVILKNNDKGIMIISDEGNKTKKTAAQYIYIPYDRLMLNNKPLAYE